MHDRRPAAGKRLEAGTGGEGFLVVLKGLGERSEALAQRSLPWASAGMIPAASTDEDGPGCQSGPTAPLQCHRKRQADWPSRGELKLASR
jgi:hypothetical protein